MHDRAITQHVAERRQTMLAVVDQRAAEMAALRHVDTLDRGGVGGPAQRFENHPAAVRDGDRARIGNRIFRLARVDQRSEEHTSELQSRQYLVCRLLLEKKKKK